MALQDTEKEMRFSVDNGVDGENFSNQMPHPPHPYPYIVDDNVPYNPATYHDVMRVSMQVVAESVARVKSDNLLDADIQELSGNTAILSSNLVELSGVVSRLKPGGMIDIDDTLSLTSKNPVENRVITTELYGVKNSVSSLSVTVNGLQSSVSTLSASVSSLGGSVQTLSGEVSGISEDLASVVADVESLSGCIDTLSSNAKSTDAALYGLIVASTSGVDGRIVEISGNLYDLSESVSVIDGEISSLSSSASGIDSRVVTLESVVPIISGTVDDLGSDVSEISGCVSSIETALSIESLKISILSSTLSGLVDHVDSLDTGIGIISGEVSDLGDEVDEISGDVYDLSISLCGEADRIDVLSSGISDIGGHLNLLDTGLSGISGAVDDVAGDVYEISGYVTEISGTVGDSSERIAILSSGLAYADARIDEISGNLSSVGGEVTELSDWCDDQFVRDEFTNFMDVPFAAEIRGGYSDDDILLIGTKRDGIHYMLPGDPVPKRCSCPDGQEEFDGYQFRNIINGNGCYVATNRDSSARTNVYSSVDGITWTKHVHTLQHTNTNGNICYSSKYGKYFHAARLTEYPALSSTDYCVEVSTDLESWDVLRDGSGNPITTTYEMLSVMCTDEYLYATSIGGNTSGDPWYIVVDLATNNIKKQGNDVFHGKGIGNAWMRWQDGNKVYWGYNQNGTRYSDRILMTDNGFETYEEYLINPGNKLGLTFPGTTTILILRSMTKYNGIYFVGTYETASPHILMSYDLKNWHVVSTPPFGIGADMLCPFDGGMYLGYSGDAADEGLLVRVDGTYHTDHLIIHGVLQDLENGSGGGGGGSLKDVEQISVPYTDKIVRAKVNEIIAALGGPVSVIPEEFTDEDIKDKVNEIISKYS